jgi:hypothetical protein
MPYTFTPPTTPETPWVNAESPPLARRLFRYYGPTNRGRSVLRIGGVYRTVDNPSQDLLATASEVYLGGHVYVVDDTTAAALSAAGYGTVSGGRLWQQLVGTWGDESSQTWWAEA